MEEVLDRHANRKQLFYLKNVVNLFQLSSISFQVQFLIVFIHTIQIQFQPSCDFPKSIGCLLTLNAGLFTYMFSSFYIKSYNKKPRQEPLSNGIDHKESNGTVANGTVGNGKLSNGKLSNGNGVYKPLEKTITSDGSPKSKKHN